MLEILPGDQVKFLGPFPPSSPLRWSVPFEFSFCGGKTRFTYAIAATSKLSRLQNKKFEFTHNYFPRRLLNEQR